MAAPRFEAPDREPFAVPRPLLGPAGAKPAAGPAPEPSAAPPAAVRAVPPTARPALSLAAGPGDRIPSGAPGPA